MVGGGWGGVVCKVIFMSNPTFVEMLLSCRLVGGLTNVFYDLLSFICSTILMNHYCTALPRTKLSTILYSLSTTTTTQTFGRVVGSVEGLDLICRLF